MTLLGSALALRLYAFGMAIIVPGEDGGGAGGLGTSGFLLAGPFELGATLSAETSGLGYRRAGIGAHAGLRIPFERFELEAAATLGGAATHMDGNFLSDDPGASGSIAFAGGRGGVDVVLNRWESSRSQANLALVFSYEHDLEPYTVEYSYVDDGWLEYDPSVEMGHKRIGMDRMAIMVAFGIGFE